MPEVELDPQNVLYQVRLGMALLDAHRDDEGIAVLQAVRNPIRVSKGGAHPPGQPGSTGANGARSTRSAANA